MLSEGQTKRNLNVVLLMFKHTVDDITHTFSEYPIIGKFTEALYLSNYNLTLYADSLNVQYII